MNIDNLEKHIKWEKYYNPDFEWNDVDFYKNSTLSEEFIDEFADKIDWSYVLSFQKLSESFIEKYLTNDKIFTNLNWGIKYASNWELISYCQNLSEAFIEQYKDYVDWKYISYYQKLSESFIEKFANRVNWEYISYRQSLSPEFKKKWKYKLK